MLIVDFMGKLITRSRHLLLDQQGLRRRASLESTSATRRQA